MSSIQKNKNEDIDEAIAILEEETQRRIEDIQQRIEFMCVSLRAQGNTEINKMLMSVRELTVEQFCETYDASIHVFLEQQAQQRRTNSSNKELKRADSTQTYMINDTSKKRRRSNSFSIAIDDVPLNTTDVEAKPKDSVEIPHNEHIAPKENVEPLRQAIEYSEPINQKTSLNEEPLVISLKRSAQPSIDIELNTRGIQEHFSVEPAMDKLNQLNEQQKKFIKAQIKDLQEKLDIFQKSIV
ncbi:hypothetical protein MAM1_0008d00927 [Mucor ambiguus]|uniref:Borealin N-terminal domain-containing protein n=1 Tax=Mucor ambiguus TaxID=91626 RepID=A0A0C9M523_9FUNG|nr:hypothetical protein MAM1_0008d00927 [Mucor ambiguus]